MNNNSNEIKLVKRDPSLHANHRSRMKEKFLKNGLEVFSEHEIMEILLYYVLPHKDTNEIAHQLINKGGSFTGAFKLPFEELKTISGIKDNAATFLKLIPEIARYYNLKEIELASSDSMDYNDIGKLCINHYIGVTETEQLLVLYFDSKMHLLHKKIIRGSSHNITTSQKEIVNDCVSKNATNCVLAHNHPTVCTMPSVDDLESTLRLQKMLLQLDINLVEHFVVSSDSCLGILKFNENTVTTYRDRNNYL